MIRLGPKLWRDWVPKPVIRYSFWSGWYTDVEMIEVTRILFWRIILLTKFSRVTKRVLFSIRTQPRWSSLRWKSIT
jgi:hypothetical protein